MRALMFRAMTLLLFLVRVGRTDGRFGFGAIAAEACAKPLQLQGESNH
jgi:hypothetical protein